MAEALQERAIAEAAREVLETMFFTEVLGEAGPQAALEGAQWVRVEFYGDPPGCVWIGLTPPAARRMAADFLGAEDLAALSEGQIGEVLCELANMIGGAVLSRLESEIIFNLAKPETAAPSWEEWDTDAACCRFDLGDGLLAVRLEMWEGW